MTGSLPNASRPSIPTESVADLIAKLEAAEVGSTVLDCDIGILLGEWEPPKGAVRDLDRPDVWRSNGIKYYQPHAEVTTSLDAALALAERVLPGWSYGLNGEVGGGALATLEQPDVDLGGGVIASPGLCGLQEFDGEAATPPLALCIAILKATTAAQSSLGGDVAEGEVNP